MPGDDSGVALSVVVVGRDGFATLRPILECLAEQTIARRIEVIAVVPVDDPSADPPPPSASAFRQFKTIAAGAISNRGTAAAQGTRHASGTIVAFTENHCFPSPDWAEKLIASYTDDLAGVGPAIVNANPEIHPVMGELRRRILRVRIAQACFAHRGNADPQHELPAAIAREPVERARISTRRRAPLDAAPQRERRTFLCSVRTRPRRISTKPRGASYSA